MPTRRVSLRVPKLQGRSWEDVSRELQDFLSSLQDSNDEGLPAGVTTSTPEEIAHNSTASLGTDSEGWIPADHVHAVSTSGTAQAIGISSSKGSANGIAAVDHTHASGLTTQGDILYANSTPAVARLPIGSAGQLLGIASGIPEWQTQSFEASWSFDSPSGSSGTFYWGGYYDFAATDNDFSPSITFGTANLAYGAHFFVVVGAATVDELTIRVTGTSITDSATRTTSDTEDIVIPNSTTVDSYFETTKKWIGQVTVEAVSGTAKTCNYGYAKYWDDLGRNYTVTGLDATWLGGASDSGADIRLRHHKTSGWTFNAAAAPTPPTPIAAMATDHSTESQVGNGAYGAWKRSGLSTDVAGSNGEGLILEVVTTANKAFELGNFLVSITPNP